MIGIMVVMLMVFFPCDELVLVLWGVDPFLRNGCGIWEQNYVAFLQENKMPAGLHSRNSILGLEFFFYLYTHWKSSPYSFCIWCESRQLGSKRS